MRPRKITAVLAVSVALVLVAREIDVRRRAQRGFAGDPAGDLSSEQPSGSGANDPGPSTECEPVVAATMDVEPAREPELSAEPEEAGAIVEQADAIANPDRIRRGPLAVAAAVIVVIVVLAGAVAAVAVGAASRQGPSHHSASSLRP